jgi:hypothetical protein
MVSRNAFVDLWPGEIPLGWELEWVEDEESRHHGWPPVVFPRSI